MSTPRRTLLDRLRALVAPPAPVPPTAAAPAEPAESAGPTALDLVEWVPEALPDAPRAVAEQVIAAYRELGR